MAWIQPMPILIHVQRHKKDDKSEFLSTLMSNGSHLFETISREL